MSRLLSTILMTFAMVSVTATGSEATDQELLGLQGEWHSVNFIFGGELAPKELTQRIKFIFTSDRLELVGLSKEKRVYTVEVDVAKKPKIMNLTPITGKLIGQTAPAIFEVKGDSLRFCMDNAINKSPEAPQKFKAPYGSSLALFEMKKVK